MAYFDPFTDREISESTFDDRVIEYQLERETIADRLDYAVERYDDANTARSQDYWSDQIESLREQLGEYDAALGSMAEQSAEFAEPIDYDVADGIDRDEFDSDDDWDFAGSESDDLDGYLDDYPDYWDEFADYADEWEFDVDYEEGE